MILSTVKQAYYPCLLGPRHGWIVRTSPPPKFAGLSDEQGNPCFYQRETFLTDDKEIWTFYCWSLSTTEQQEKAVDDYLYLLKRNQNEATHEADMDLAHIKQSKAIVDTEFIRHKPKPPRGRIIVPGETA